MIAIFSNSGNEIDTTTFVAIGQQIRQNITCLTVYNNIGSVINSDEIVCIKPINGNCSGANFMNQQNK